MCHIAPVTHFSFEERQLHFLLLIHITQVFEMERKQTSLVNLSLIQTQSPLLLVTFLLGSPANLTGFYNRSDLLPGKNGHLLGGNRGRSWWLEEPSQKLSWSTKLTISSQPPLISLNKIEQDGFAHGWSWKKLISSS